MYNMFVRIWIGSKGSNPALQSPVSPAMHRHLVRLSLNLPTALPREPPVDPNAKSPGATDDCVSNASHRTQSWPLPFTSSITMWRVSSDLRVGSERHVLAAEEPEVIQETNRSPEQLQEPSGGIGTISEPKTALRSWSLRPSLNFMQNDSESFNPDCKIIIELDDVPLDENDDMFFHSPRSSKSCSF